MNEASHPVSDGSYDPFLTERLELLRAQCPGRPLPYYRMLLIQIVREELSLPPKDAMRLVDDFYNARGLGIRQPTVIQAILFGIVASLVFVVPMLLFYWLWLRFQPR